MGVAWVLREILMQSKQDLLLSVLLSGILHKYELLMWLHCPDAAAVATVDTHLGKK